MYDCRGQEGGGAGLLGLLRLGTRCLCSCVRGVCISAYVCNLASARERVRGGEKECRRNVWRTE